MGEKQTSPNLSFPSGSRRTTCCLDLAPGAEVRGKLAYVRCAQVQDLL